jgi:CubicO group peptidase (beta-lactamase class C family)
MADGIAGQRPRWEPGSAFGYHSWTYGVLLAEILRRATGRTCDQLLREERAGPLGIGDELLFHVPEHLASRVAAMPASAAASSCRPVSHGYTVSQEKVAVHATPSPRGSVVGYKYKDNKVHADYACSNSTGNWVCIGRCHVDEDAIAGRWVFRNDPMG